MAFLDKLKKKFTKSADKDKYLKGFSKSRKSFADKLNSMSNKFSAIDDKMLDELMVLLLESDIGMDMASKVVEQFEKRKWEIANYPSISDYLVAILKDLYGQEEEEDLHINPDGPTIILMIGVNGSGKTTTIAKLASRYKDDYSVMTVAADTFRAGATEQLQTWADRLDIECVSGRENQDPASVIVDGLRKAKQQQSELVLCDTAGRLQNKKNLMNELAKISRVAGREIEGAPHETWLVLDGTTGQNGILQAREFMECTPITGIILTKMDGTAKGGVVLSIKDQLGIPVRFLGLGEKPEDLQPFDLDFYLESIAKGLS